MDRKDYLCYVNASGKEVVLSSPDISRWFELRGRTGFTAPEIELIKQKYANGKTKILKRQLKPRQVSVTMMVTGSSEAERDRVFFEMISRLMDIDGGDVGKLYVRRCDGMVVYLNCAYSSGLSVYEEYRRFQKFTLEFYAPDVYFYRDLDDVTVNVNYGNFLTLNDNLLFGNYHKIGEFDSSGSGDVLNTGTENLQPVIRLQHVVGSVRIANESANNEITIKGIQMASGQTLVIDTRDDYKSIYIVNEDGLTIQAGQYLDWSNQDYYFPIIPGNNHISFSGSEGSKIDKLTISMAQRYLSA